jgi:hypothetical protein
MYAMEEKGGSLTESPVSIKEKQTKNMELPEADYVDLSPLPDKLRGKLVVLKGSELGRREAAWGDVILVGTGRFLTAEHQHVACNTSGQPSCQETPVDHGGYFVLDARVIA